MSDRLLLMNKCIDCCMSVEYCVCEADALFEDEEASDYIDVKQDLKRLQLPDVKKLTDVKPR